MSNKLSPGMMILLRDDPESPVSREWRGAVLQARNYVRPGASASFKIISRRDGEMVGGTIHHTYRPAYDSIYYQFKDNEDAVTLLKGATRDVAISAQEGR